MKRVIRLGDPTSHGGSVVRVAATHSSVMGKPLARAGDPTSHGREIMRWAPRCGERAIL